MRHRLFFLGIAFVGTSALSPSTALSQAQTTSSRIPQQIVINGQMASGAYVMGTGGQLQSFSCPSPQQYSTADGSSQGWACYEQTTGVWLLSALPPAPAPQAAPAAPPARVAVPQASSQPTFVTFPRPVSTVIYRPPPTVVYALPPPVVVGPAYPSSVILGRTAIDAAGRIAGAAIFDSRYSRGYITFNRYGIRDRGRNHGRRW